MNDNWLVETSGLSVTFVNIQILTNVNLIVYQNDFIGVIGPNGGGKTTLMKSILGLVDYSGNISYNNALIDSTHPIGYMPQINDFDKAFPITVKELILSGLQGGGKAFFGSRKSNRKLVEYVANQCGIASKLNNSINHLSGGELQRAVLCRAIISSPRLLILDEPANFVDNEFEKELYELLKELNESMAIIIVSHDIGTISSVVKSIVCVNRTVHRHDSNLLTPEMLDNYRCPIQIVEHGDVPHTALKTHQDN